MFPVNFSCWVLGKESGTHPPNYTGKRAEEGLYMHITIRACHAASGREAETGHRKVRKMSNDGLFVLVVVGFELITTGCHIDK